MVQFATLTAWWVCNGSAQKFATLAGGYYPPLHGVFFKISFLQKCGSPFLRIMAVLSLSSQSGPKTGGDQQQIQGIFNGGDHHIGVQQQTAAAALFAHDTDGQVADIGHENIIKAVADAHHAALARQGLLGFDPAHLGSGEGQNGQGQPGAFLGGGAMGIGGDDTDAEGTAQLFQPGSDPGKDFAVLGDGSVVIQDQMGQAEFFSAGNGDLEHGIPPVYILYNILNISEFQHLSSPADACEDIRAAYQES